MRDIWKEGCGGCVEAMRKRCGFLESGDAEGTKAVEAVVDR